MKFNRRKFISSSVLAYIGITVASNVVLKSISNVLDTIEETIAQKLKRAGDLRKQATSLQTNMMPQGISPMGTMSAMSSVGSSPSLLYQAETIYDEVITLAPNEFRAYDGKRKILLQDRYNELAVFNVFNSASIALPDNVYLKERLAKEYMRLSLGNKKFTQQLNDATSEDLLLISNQLFNDVRTSDPENVQFETQYQKSERLMEQDAATLDARDNPELKIYRRQNRDRYNSRFDDLTASEVKDKLDPLISIPENIPVRIHHVREVYKIYISKLIKENQINTAVSEAKKLYYVDKNDYNSLHIIRNICNKNQLYGELEEIERSNDAIKNSMWSGLALFDVLYRRYKKESYGSFSEMKDILTSLAPEEKPYLEYIEIKTREIKLALLQNNQSEAYNLLKSLADKMTGITSAHWIDRFNCLCVSYYRQIGDVPNAMMVLNIALKENNSPLTDELLEKVHLVNRRRETEKHVHDERLNNLRNQLF